VPLIKERIKKLGEAVTIADFLFVDELEYDPQSLIGKGMDTASAATALRTAQATLEKYPEGAFDDEEKIEAELRAASDKLGMKYALFFGTLRVAATGKTVSPPLMGSMRILGSEKTLRRIARAITALAKG
jgi:glutamyl-tRNA synthetase